MADVCLYVHVTSFVFSDLHGTDFFHLLISFTLAALSIMFSNGGIGIYPLAVEESLIWYGIEAVNGLAFGCYVVIPNNYGNYF